MRTELQKLLEVIQVKDQEIEELEEQLLLSKKQVDNKYVCPLTSFVIYL